MNSAELRISAQSKDQASRYDGRGGGDRDPQRTRNVNYTNVLQIVYCRVLRRFTRTERTGIIVNVLTPPIRSTQSSGVCWRQRTELWQYVCCKVRQSSLKEAGYAIIIAQIRASAFSREDFLQINIHHTVQSQPGVQPLLADVFGTARCGRGYREIQEAGRGPIPGGGGEYIVETAVMRDRICAVKVQGRGQWLEVMRIAHERGHGKSSCQMMFGPWRRLRRPDRSIPDTHLSTR